MVEVTNGNFPRHIWAELTQSSSWAVVEGAIPPICQTAIIIIFHHVVLKALAFGVVFEKAIVDFFCSLGGDLEAAVVISLFGLVFGGDNPICNLTL